MSDDSVRTEARIIGEFLAPLAAGMPGALGLADDCALACPSPGHEFVLKTDAIAAGVHFLEEDPPADIGWKALAVNVSDLAAKGATPVGYLMSLAFPEAPRREWLAEFVRGLDEAQKAFGIGLLGGDTDRRPGPLSITPTVIGEVPAGGMVRRTTAQPGDIVMVSGTLGDATLGLRLRRDPALPARWQLAEADARALVRRYLRPLPRLALRSALRGRARAAMDLSDGLMKDLGRMCAASSCAATVRLDALPRSAGFAAVESADPGAADAARFAGDDYEILAAMPPDAVADFTAIASASGVPVTAIGSFAAGFGVTLLDASGRPITLAATGWDHF